MFLGSFFYRRDDFEGYFLKIFLWLVIAIVNGIPFFGGGVYLIQNYYFELGVIIISALLLIVFFLFLTQSAILIDILSQL